VGCLPRSIIVVIDNVSDVLLMSLICETTTSVLNRSPTVCSSSPMQIVYRALGSLVSCTSLQRRRDTFHLALENDLAEFRYGIMSPSINTATASILLC